MQKKGGPESLPHIARVIFAWLVFAACALSETLVSEANMMVTVKLTIILSGNYKRFGH